MEKSSWLGNRRTLTIVVFTIGCLAFGTYGVKSGLFSGLPGLHKDVLFCSGTDPKTGESKIVRVSDTGADRGHLRVLAKAKSADAHLTVNFEDPNGLIVREGPEKRANRISFQLNDRENLQVYRECGAKPTCRFEHIHHLPSDEFKRAQAKINEMERTAFEARAQTAQVAERYAALRGKLMESQKQLAMAKQGKNSRAIASAEKNFKEVNQTANDVVGELHSSTVATDAIHKQMNALKEDMRMNGTRAQTTELIPSQVEEWCSK